MFHFFGTVTNDRGDSLAGWQVEVVDLSDGETVIPIFSDESGTPIATVSGVTDRSLSDVSGNYDFFVANGTYSLRFYDDSGEFQRLQRYLPMYGAYVPTDINEETGTTYTLGLNDAGTVLQLNNASPITLTIPPNSTAAIPVGAGIEIQQMGAGQVTFSAGSGVTLRVRGSFTQTGGQYAIAGLRKIATNTWIMTGDLT